MLPFAAIVLTVVYLAARGAGMFAGATYVSAAFLSLTLLILAVTSQARRQLALPFGWLSFLLLAWLILTTIPLPQSAENLVSAARRDENQLARSLLADIHSIHLIADPASNFSLSRNKGGTIRWILAYITILASLALAASLQTAWKYRYLRFLVYFTASIAALGIVGQYFIPQYGRIWWRFPVAEGEPVACFVNRNHYGGFVVLLCPAAIVLAARDFSERQWALACLGVLCFGVMSAAVVVSMSRGAFATYFICLYLVIIASIRRRSKRRFGLVICAVTFCSFIGIALFVHGGVEERLRTMRRPEAASSAQARITVWEDALRAWREYPIAGAGADGFRMVFPRFKTWKIDRSFLHAENEYLQLLVDGGLIGVGLVGGLLIGCFRLLYRAAAANKERPELAISATCALISVMIHAGVDVAMSIPLYATVLASIVGLPLGMAERQGTENATAGISPVQRRVVHFSVCSFAAVTLFYWQYGIRIYQADKSWYIQSADPDELSQALCFAPTFWHAWYHLGRYGLAAHDEAGVRFAERCLTVAAVYNPTDSRIWESLISLRRELGDDAGARAAHRRMILELTNTEARPHIARMRRASSAK